MSTDEEAGVDERPRDEGRPLPGMIREPPDRQRREREVRRVQERHQPAFEVAAAHQQLLRRSLCRLRVQLRGAAVQDQVPRTPEHGEIGGRQDLDVYAVADQDDEVADRQTGTRGDERAIHLARTAHCSSL